MSEDERQYVSPLYFREEGRNLQFYAPVGDGEFCGEPFSLGISLDQRSLFLRFKGKRYTAMLEFVVMDMMQAIMKGEAAEKAAPPGGSS